MSSIFIGIDPGKLGHVASLSADGGVRGTWPTPTIKMGKGKPQYDILSMRRILKEATEGCDSVHVAIEKQTAMPMQGVVSMFSIGEGYGIWQGLLSGLELSYEVVTPQKWKKAMLAGIPGVGKDKKRSVIAAGRLFPGVDLRLNERCRVACVDKCEALLIAEYGRRQECIMRKN